MGKESRGEGERKREDMYSPLSIKIPGNADAAVQRNRKSFPSLYQFVINEAGLLRVRKARPWSR